MSKVSIKFSKFTISFKTVIVNVRAQNIWLKNVSKNVSNNVSKIKETTWFLLF